MVEDTEIRTYRLCMKKTMTKTNDELNRGAQSPAEFKIPELLAPAGSFEKLETAIFYGADAVYLAGTRYSLRARATNFTEQELQRAVDYAHAHQVRVYCTVNILAHNADFAGLNDYLRFLNEAGVDGLIIADPGILLAARETVPDLPVHLSTQANVTNTASARFWQAQGVRRLNLAREMSLAEITAIRQGMTAELEVFVHGALCISYSGRCLLSQYLTGRGANQGDCAQPCRYSYQLIEEKRPGQFFPVEEDEYGTYIFNSRDLCLLGRLPDLLRAGVDCLKIEGRMKSVAYVGSVVRLYRAALDYLAEHGLPPVGRDWLPEGFARELTMIGSRGYTENFLDGRPTDAGTMQYKTTYIKPQAVPVGLVRQVGEWPVIEARNPIEVGEVVEYLDKGLGNYPLTVTEMRREEGGEPVTRANPNDRLILKTNPSPPRWELHALLRKGVKSNQVTP